MAQGIYGEIDDWWARAGKAQPEERNEGKDWSRVTSQGRKTSKLGGNATLRREVQLLGVVELVGVCLRSEEWANCWGARFPAAWPPLAKSPK